MNFNFRDLNLKRVVWGICGVVTTFSYLWFNTHDAHPIRSHLEEVVVNADLQKVLAEEATKQASETTKQIQAKAAISRLNGVPVATSQVGFVSQSDIEITGGQHILSTGHTFVFNGSPDKPVARVLFTATPRIITGGYKLVLESDRSKTVWSSEWSAEPMIGNAWSDFFAIGITTSSHDSRWVLVYAKGTVRITM